MHKALSFIDKDDGVVLREGNIKGSKVLGLPVARLYVCLSRLYDACATHISLSQHREAPAGSGPRAQGNQQQVDVADLLNKLVASMAHRSPDAVRDVDENQAEREGKRNAQVLATYEEKVRLHGESPLQKSDMVVDSVQVHVILALCAFDSMCTSQPECELCAGDGYASNRSGQDSQHD